MGETVSAIGAEVEAVSDQPAFQACGGGTVSRLLPLGGGVGAPEVLLPDVLEPDPVLVGAGPGPSPLVEPLVLPVEIALPHEPDVHEPFTLQAPAALLHDSSILLPVALPEQLRFDPS